jgi:type II secretory ATPase GspE/PulE/Tfp pilus assembly ATPase PilB-like protein
MTALETILPPAVLTAPGKKWEVNAELRERLCLTDDQVLHIAVGYGADPFVLVFIEKLKRAGVIHTTEYVEPEALASLYRGVAALPGASRTSQSSTGKHDAVVEILRNATQAGASDIHFFPTPNGHLLRYRIHGELETVTSFVGNDGEQLLSAIYGSMSESTDTSYQANAKQDGRLRSEFVTECGLFGARLATRPTLNGPWMAMRLLYDSGTLISLDDMGYLPEQIATLTRLIHRTDGAVFLTGTTGSGKSTSIQTLLTMLLEAMAGSINLVTVEDPVEYRIPGANQTPLKEAWVEAIANLMRLDPDVLLIGETRDTASALAAFQAVLTGHGVWSTLHVNSAAASLQRLEDLGVDRNLLLDPGLIKGLVNQSLTRVLCPQCKTPYLPRRDQVSVSLRARIEAHCIPEQVFLKGEGCERCNGRGIVRRTAIAEIISPDLAFMRRFRDLGKAEAQAFWVTEQGGITKNRHLIQRINEGLVDPSHGERDVCSLDEDMMTLGVCA